MQDNKTEECEALINEIDSALLCLHKGQENKAYIFFDYLGEVKKILSRFRETNDENLRRHLHYYFAVFNDLHKPAGEDIAKFTSFDTDKGLAFFTKFRKFIGVDKEIKVSENNSISLCLISDERGNHCNEGTCIPSTFNKMSSLIEGCHIYWPEKFSYITNSPENLLRDFFSELLELYFRSNINIASIDLSITLEKYVNLFQVRSEETKKIELTDFFKPSYKDLVNRLLYECDVIDENNELLLTKGNGTVLFGLIAAIKKNSTKLLIRNYPYPQLLAKFNEYLGTNYKQVKPNSLGAEDASIKACKIIGEIK